MSETWRHKKTGGVYRILAHARLEATLEDVTVYRNIKTGEIWVRPGAEFFDGRFEAQKVVPSPSSSGGVRHG